LGGSILARGADESVACLAVSSAGYFETGRGTMETIVMILFPLQGETWWKTGMLSSISNQELEEWGIYITKYRKVSVLTTED
jgi:hypothetical protein